jgi:tripartite-type tricarboxylate transporter receptor subunit TctC
MRIRTYVRTAGAAILLLLSLSLGHNAIAQEAWPHKPVRIIVPYPPGGTADMLGRVLAQHLSEVFKQQFVIENRGGAGGVIGSQVVARSEPDGYTLGVVGVGSHVVAPATMSKSYDAMKEFTHIAMLGGPATVLVVNSTVPVKTLDEFVRYVRSQPAGVSWGSPGPGTHGHLIGELYKATTKLNMVHISYKGAGPALGDLLGNQIPVAFMTLSSAGQHIKTGKLRGIAVTSDKRAVNYPEVPTFAELGQPEFTAMSWFGLSGPANLPPQIVNRLNAEVQRALNKPDVRDRFASEGIETRAMDAAAFTRFFKSEIDFWEPHLKALKEK